VDINKVITDFSERLKELLLDKGMSVEQLADAIGVARATAYYWTTKPKHINRYNLIKVADFFDCRIEYLIGHTEDDTKVTPKLCPDFVMQVRKIMKEKSISTYKLEKTSKFKCSYFSKWKRGNEPSLQTLIDLAKIFDCTIDYLVGRE